MDLNKHVESPMRKTGDWGFIGYIQKYGPKSQETMVPIGVYSSYRDGAAHANSWMANEPRAVRWEGQPMYEEIHDGEDE